MELVKVMKRGFKTVVSKAKSLLANPRVQMMCLFAIFGTMSIFAAADPGQTALGDVANDIAAYIPIVCKLCYALAGIVAILGTISIYIAMNNDDQDVKKKIMMTVGACIFLVAAAQALPKFFGVDVKAGTVADIE